MLDKKSLFNFVYAIALVGAVMSCIGILNEFLNIAQLYKINITSMITMQKGNYFVPFFFYLVAFIISGVALTLVIFRLLGNSKVNKADVNALVFVACVVLLVMSFVFILFLRKYVEYNQHYILSYSKYLFYYTFRTGVMSFVANMGVILVCNLVDEKNKKVQQAE